MVLYPLYISWQKGGKKMLITFYQTKSEPHRVDKVLTNATNKQGHLKAECSIINPSITMDLDNNILVFNYVYIQAFQRYYYITNVDIINGMMVVNMHVDVLMSFKDDIKTTSGHIVRSNHGNKYIKDNMAYSTAKPVIQARNLGTCFTKGAYYIMVKGGQ